MCGLCVQWIADWKHTIADPSTSEGERERLEGVVKDREGWIQLLQSQQIVKHEVAASRAHEALQSTGNLHDDVMVMNIIKTWQLNTCCSCC